MKADDVMVFFYGLFMDESLLASKGIHASSAIAGYVDGYGLRIGRRATLVPDETRRTYGILMAVPTDGVKALYADEGLADYVPESVSVQLPDGTLAPAVCYLLPAGKLEGTNAQYAKSLRALAGKLGFPDTYLRQIEEHAG